MFKERNQTGGNADHLAWRNVDEINVFDFTDFIFAVSSSNDVSSNRLIAANNASVLNVNVCRSEEESFFLVSAKPFNLFLKDAVLNNLIRRGKEPEFVYRGVSSQRRNQTDVCTFRGFNGANSTKVRVVNVSNFGTGALTVQTARTQSGQTAFVRKHGQRVGLVDNL